MAIKSLSCNVAIIPPSEVSKRAVTISKKLEQYGTYFTLDGKKYYPHITLYMTEFPSKNIERIKKLLHSIVESTLQFQIVSREIRQLNNDGFVDVAFEKNTEVGNLQKRIIGKLNPLREGLLRKKDLTMFNTFSHLEQRNLTAYGYKDVSESYIPHLTFTRFPKLKNIILKNENCTFTVKNIGLFQSGNHGTCNRLIADFRLKS